MSIVSTTKELLELAKKGATIELEAKLVEMQERELELREELLRIKTLLASLEKRLEIEDSLALQNGVYMLDDKQYCQLCWDSEKKLINLQEKPKYDINPSTNRQYVSGSYYECFKCKSRYRT